MSLFDLSGKKALVTGGSGQLGPIWIETLRGAGCIVYEIDLPWSDVRDKAQIRDVVGAWGAMDIIVNNAAIDNPPDSGASFFGNCSEIVDVNLLGAINVCEVFIPLMIENGGGIVVNIGSIMGSIGADWRNYPEGFEKPVGYNLSKAALVQLSRSITVQYGRYNVRSVTIAFGPYDGGKLKQEFLGKFLPNVPLKRTISKESLQASLLYACCCPELAGQQVLVDGGYTAW